MSKDSKEIVKQLFEKSSELVLPTDTIFIVGSKRILAFKADALIRFVNNYSFERLFFDTRIKLKSESQSTIIRIETIEPSQWIYYLKYLYDGRVMLRYQEIASTCLGALENSILELPTKLLKFCDKHLNIYNVVIIYDQYLKMNNLISADRMNRVEEMINLNASLVFKSNCFLEISKETLIKLLQNDSLFIKEKDVYYAVLDWINAELSRPKKAINLKNQISLFNEFKNLIRFTLMTKKQFDNGPAKCKFFSNVELKEFEQFFSSQNEKVLSVNYNVNERNALMIYKLQFDNEINQYRQLDRFHDEKNIDESEIDEKLIDYIEREKFMIKKFKKTYFKDGLRKKKFATKKDQVDEAIHVFKFGINIDKKIWNDELLMEIHENGKKLDLQFVSYSKSGKYYFSLCSPVIMTNAKEYRICLRTRSNQCLCNSLKIENVITLDENECKIDVKFKILDEVISVADKIEIYFVYKENYVIEEESIQDESSSLKNDEDDSIENMNPNSKRKSTKNSQRKKRKIISDDSETDYDFQ